MGKGIRKRKGVKRGGELANSSADDKESAEYVPAKDASYSTEDSERRTPRRKNKFARDSRSAGAKDISVRHLYLEQHALKLLSSGSVASFGGQPFVPRSGHSAAVYKNNVIIFGGAGTTKSFSDVMALNLDTKTWHSFSCRRKPKSRAYHTSEIVGDRLFVFGGWSNGRFFDDVCVLSELDAVCSGGEGGKWFSLSTTTSAPPARAMHSMTLVGKNIYIIGGWKSGAFFSDVYILDTDNLVWSVAPKTSTAKVWTAPRAGHSASNVGDKIYCFGGQNSSGILNDLVCFNPADHTWTIPKASGKSPVPRAAHTATVVGSRIYLVGGWYGAEYQYNIDCYDTKSNTWSQVASSGLLPCTLSAHTASTVGDKVYVIGGWHGYAFQENVVEIDTASWKSLSKDKQSKDKLSRTADRLAGKDKLLRPMLSQNLLELASQLDDDQIEVLKMEMLASKDVTQYQEDDAKADKQWRPVHFILIVAITTFLLVDIALMAVVYLYPHEAAAWLDRFREVLQPTFPSPPSGMDEPPLDIDAGFTIPEA